MPRTRRFAPDNSIHHVLNRGNRRATIFHKAADYEAFMNLLGATLDDVPMRILGVCLMPNHFHLVLWPEEGIDLSAYMHCLMNAHVRRYHEHYQTSGLGHIYQGRFRNFVVQSDAHLYKVLRYVEANALRAGLVSDARLWRWSSLARRFTPNGRTYLSEWPVPRPADWADLVNTGLPGEDLRQLQQSVRKGTPYGDQRWTGQMIERHGLQFTQRAAGRRPKQLPGSAIALE
jgi:putative transposase